MTYDEAHALGQAIQEVCPDLACAVRPFEGLYKLVATRQGSDEEIDLYDLSSLYRLVRLALPLREPWVLRPRRYA